MWMLHDVSFLVGKCGEKEECKVEEKKESVETVRKAAEKEKMVEKGGERELKRERIERECFFLSELSVSSCLPPKAAFTKRFTRQVSTALHFKCVCLCMLVFQPV